ncbi:NAD(P)H-dependent flavin oxidoreductase [Pseudorhodoferax sp.]|uniref:NAD(P)H-dependent flavin oxidoreductase n=1 Tax=Pseudorhodoferax sp. TaxID=1993553 RepID=UPI002DD68F70|nr:nitronate monooxygenase [Pseudorhodoferax sp.]
MARFRALRLPVLAAPMFLVSGPELVVAASSAGVIGTFPAPNCRTTQELSAWLAQISGALRGAGGLADACWGVNLVVHRTNARLAADLEVVVRHRVPLVIASVGSAAPVVAPVHGYGGLVFTDVVSLKHARQAIAAGVDGLILLTTGAGGHEGTANPFAFVREIRRIFDGPIVLAGCVADGESILAARALGADGVAIGTAFIAATESMASDAYRDMLLQAGMDDILCSSALTGMNANLLRDSFTRAGFDASRYARRPGDVDVGDLIDHDLQKQRWKDIWAAGQGAGGVRSVQPAAAIVAQFERGYHAALAGLVPGAAIPPIPVH